MMRMKTAKICLTRVRKVRKYRDNHDPLTLSLSELCISIQVMMTTRRMTMTMMKKKKKKKRNQT